jgi:Protein of unknown function (DUF3311)
MAQPEVSRTPTRRSRRHPALWVVAAVLLAASLVAVLWVPFYNFTSPTLANFPFFYWYQLLWVPIVAILGALAYAVTRAAGLGRGNAATPSGSQTAAEPPGRGRGEVGG